MVWYIIAAILFCVALVLMLYIYVRDKRYLKKKTSSTMSENLWNEIQEEREASKQRRDKFRAALHEAEKSTADKSKHGF